MRDISIKPLTLEICPANTFFIKIFSLRNLNLENYQKKQQQKFAVLSSLKVNLFKKKKTILM